VTEPQSGNRKPETGGGSRFAADIPPQALPYDRLQTELQLPTIRELEDLIIDVIYAGLLGGKMHHHEKVLHVDWAAGRDLTMQDLEETRKGLENW
jgi:COP9 signalosome complex subunit 7